MESTTIYTQEPGKYHVQKTIGGWVVIYIIDRYHAVNADGSRLHKSRQNAYAKAQRLNDALKRAIAKTGMAEAVYSGDYIANVESEQGEFADQYSLTLRKGMMPPFETKFFHSLDDLEQYARETLPQPLAWHKVTPEEI